MPALFLVADVLGVAEGGDGPDVGEVAAQPGNQLREARLDDRDDGGGAGVARTPVPLVVLPADGRGEAVGAAQLGDGAGLAVVAGEDDGAGALPGRELVPDAADGGGELGPADRLDCDRVDGAGKLPGAAVAGGSADAWLVISQPPRCIERQRSPRCPCVM